MTSLFLDTLNGTETDRVPFWFMRQAGRYLPEYREIRKNYKHFLDFCYTPSAAIEVTLQPIRRFDMDAAILFSDILVLPHAMGANVWFEEGEGPRIEAITNMEQLEKLSAIRVIENLSPVFEILKGLKKSLPEEKALIGFAGSPWTIACYMVQGRGQGKEQNGFAMVRQKAKEDKAFFSALIAKITEATIIYLLKQIESGADAIQLFDSWSGVLDEEEFLFWSSIPTKAIVSAIRKVHKDIPIIGFPRGSGRHIMDYVVRTGVTAVSVDESHPVSWVRDALQQQVVVQGGITNAVLAEDKTKATEETKNILSSWSSKPFIFNLAHGILPHTPVEHVEAVAKTVKAFRRNR